MNQNYEAYMKGYRVGFAFMVVALVILIILIIYFSIKKKKIPLIVTSVILSLFVILRLIGFIYNSVVAKENTATTAIEIKDSDYIGYTEYKDALDKVEAKYPDNWKMIDKKTILSMESNVDSAFGFIDNSRNDNIICLLLPEELSITLAGAENMAKGSLDSLGSVFTSTNVSKDVEIISIGGRKFGTYQVTGSNEDITVTQEVIYTTINNGTLITTLTSKTNSISQKDELLLYRVAASFKKVD